MKKTVTTLGLIITSLLGFSQGFSTKYISWGLPLGGATIASGHNLGFNETYGYPSTFNNSQGWITLDINGDGKPDLVSTSQGNGTYADAFSVGSNPHWNVYLNTGTGMSNSITPWALPLGGSIDSAGHNYGFNATYDSISNINNSQGWNTFDINGDGKPDLVIMSQGDGTYADCFGVGTNPHWNVYLNTGSGFSAAVTSWALPSGGHLDASGHNYGFNDTKGVASFYNNSLTWNTLDMNGDGKPDLVTTAIGDGTHADCFGVGTNPHWNIYLNTGNGFSTVASTWILPTGGNIDASNHNYGFYETIGSISNYINSLAWNTLDINGDGKPDLVVTSKGSGIYADCFGVGVNPCWNVYLNSGAGFSTTFTTWPLPSGGHKNLSGHNFGFYQTTGLVGYFNNCLTWSTFDINGDGMADLVTTSKGDGTYSDCFGVGTNPHWNVYLNSGTGFSSIAFSWALPAGGNIGFNAHNYGFYEANSLAERYNNCLAWSTTDIDGDGKSDLVVTSQANGTYSDCFGVGTSPFWKVYLDTAVFVGISEIENGIKNISISPNPVSDNLTVMINKSLIDEPYYIFDSYGRVIFKDKLYSETNIVELKKLTSGIYFLQVGKQLKQTVKVIKQ